MSRAHAKPERGKRVLVAGIAIVATPTAVASFAGAESDGLSIACPQPVVPQAPAEVQRELANLDKQLVEANARLRTSAGQGGPNFVQSATLGPLVSKRTAALDRIAISIGRVGTRPQGLERFVACALK